MQAKYEKLHSFSIQDLMIDAEKVAHVQLNNPLEHALLVLIKSGYSAVPVLDEHFKLRGVISKTLILDSILGLEAIEFEQLNNHFVYEVMKKKVAIVGLHDSFDTILTKSIDEPFLCVEDDQKLFCGIITRSKLLAFIKEIL